MSTPTSTSTLTASGTAIRTATSTFTSTPRFAARRAHAPARRRRCPRERSGAQALALKERRAWAAERGRWVRSRQRVAVACFREWRKALLHEEWTANLARNPGTRSSSRRFHLSCGTRRPCSQHPRRTSRRAGTRRGCRRESRRRQCARAWRAARRATPSRSSRPFLREQPVVHASCVDAVAAPLVRLRAIATIFQHWSRACWGGVRAGHLAILAVEQQAPSRDAEVKQCQWAKGRVRACRWMATRDRVLLNGTGSLWARLGRWRTFLRTWLRDSHVDFLQASQLFEPVDQFLEPERFRDEHVEG